MCMNKPVYLIGGAPTAGKSTVAKAFSKKLGLPWVSTDQIREVMRSATTKEQNPKLFTPGGFTTAEEFYAHFSVEDIVNTEYEQAEVTWPGILEMVRDYYAWSEGCIIEGVALWPDLVKKYYKDASVVYLIDEDKERVSDVVYKRGVFGAADSYSDSVKPKEVEWLLLFAKRLKEQAEECGHDCFQVEKNDNDLKRVLESFGL